MTGNCWCGHIRAANCTRCNLALCSVHSTKFPETKDRIPSKLSSLEAGVYSKAYSLQGNAKIICHDCRQKNATLAVHTARETVKKWPRDPFERLVVALASDYESSDIVHMCQGSTVTQLLTWWTAASKRAGIRMVTVRRQRLVTPAKKAKFLSGPQPATYTYDQVSAWKLTTYIRHGESIYNALVEFDRTKYTYENSYLLPDGEIIKADGTLYHKAEGLLKWRGDCLNSYLLHTLTTMVGEARELYKKK